MLDVRFFNSEDRGLALQNLHIHAHCNKKSVNAYARASTYVMSDADEGLTAEDLQGLATRIMPDEVPSLRGTDSLVLVLLDNADYVEATKRLFRREGGKITDINI